MVGKAFEPVTKSDDSPYVLLTIYAGFFSALLFWVARILYRWRRIGLKKDDAFLIPAMFLALAQTICIQEAANAGLGERPTADDIVHLDRFEKPMYASNLLNILCQAASKVSVACLVHQLQPFRTYLVANYASLTLIAGWTIAFLLALAFECDLPHPWRLGLDRCLDRRKLFLGIDITNILSEGMLVLAPALLMLKVETTNSIRLTVAGCFAARLAVVAALIVHITTLHHLVDDAYLTWSYTTPAIWLQVVMNVSVLTACIPGAQHILSELRAGLLTIKVESESPDASRYGSVFGTNSDHIRTHISAKSNDAKVWEMTRMTSGSATRSSGKEKEADTESERSLTGKGINVVKEVDQTSLKTSDGSKATKAIC